MKDMQEEPDFHTKYLKWLPLIALIVALFALSFQVFVLYPWHEELSREFVKFGRK
jgi:hypothetical protein